MITFEELEKEIQRQKMEIIMNYMQLLTMKAAIVIEGIIIAMF